MLRYLGAIIEKKPWLVIIVILLITAGFSTFLPQIEMKTEFEDFMPEQEVVKTNDRITEYFGQNIQTMFLLVEKQNTESTLSPKAIREMYYVEENIKELKEVNSTISIVTFIDQICQIEFGKKIDSSFGSSLSKNVTFFSFSVLIITLTKKKKN
jgi:predicted RND superfamily exporter protein